MTGQERGCEGEVCCLPGRERSWRLVRGDRAEEVGRGTAGGDVTGRRRRRQETSEVRSEAGSVEVVADWRRNLLDRRSRSQVEDHPVRARGRGEVEGGERLGSEVRGERLE